MAKNLTLFQRRQHRRDNGWMKWSPEVLPGVGDLPPTTSFIWNPVWFLSGSQWAVTCWEPSAKVCSSHAIDEEGRWYQDGSTAFILPGDAPWQPITSRKGRCPAKDCLLTSTLTNSSKRSNDAPEKRTTPKSAFLCCFSQLSTLGPIMPGCGSGLQDAVSLLLAVL